ncbi:hypothetical protein GCM10020258_20640 [Sphingomonas yabuuchiae]
MKSKRWAGHALAALLTLSVAAPAMAQADKMAPIAIPAQPTAIPLNTGPLPGAKNKESWHSQYNSVFARNVTEATLTPSCPIPPKRPVLPSSSRPAAVSVPCRCRMKAGTWPRRWPIAALPPSS